MYDKEVYVGGEIDSLSCFATLSFHDVCARPALSCYTPSQSLSRATRLSKISSASFELNKSKSILFDTTSTRSISVVENEAHIAKQKMEKT